MPPNNNQESSFEDQLKKLEQLLNDFQTALEAAKKVDKLIGQPDCEDPEKKSLLDRVSALEKELQKIKKEKIKQKRSRKITQLK